MKIYGALCEINKRVDAIGKGRRNQQQGFNFRGIDDVMNELHAAFAENGVFIVPEPVGDMRIEFGKTKSGGDMFHIFQQWKFTFCADDGSTVSACGIGEAMDTGDKATNKSMSIALKYVLLQMFLIPTEEEKDPDYQSHQSQRQLPQQQQPQTAQKEVMTDCTKLVDIALKHGMSLEQAIAMAEEKYRVSDDMKRQIADRLIGATE